MNFFVTNGPHSGIARAGIGDLVHAHMISLSFLFAIVAALWLQTPARSEQRLKPINSACRIVVQQSVSWLMAADAAANKQRSRAANTSLDHALATLGDAYSNDKMLDDSGMHLSVATMIAESGELKRAADVKRRVLTERLVDCGVHPSSPPAVSVWRCPTTNKTHGCDMRTRAQRDADRRINGSAD